MGYTTVSITKAEKAQSAIDKFLPKFRLVKFSDLNMFNQQFATLQKAGLPIILSLTALKEQTTNKLLQDVIGQVVRDIEAGASLSAALEKHPRIFNPIYVSMVKSGEISGTLDESLARLATLGEHEEKVNLRLKAATRYPIIVVGFLILSFFVLITVVVPKFAALYARFTTTLPLPTRILIAINNIVTNFWWTLILGIAILFLGLYRFINSKVGRLWWDKLKLKVPVFGPLLLKLMMSRFSRVTGTLMRSGIPILEVLKLTSEMVGNVIVAKTMQDISVSVTEGKGLVEPMKESGIFPPVVVQMVLVGEESGKIDELLLHVSNYYDQQVDYTISNLIVLIEPFLILVLGSIVLFMALGIFLPIWELMQLYRPS